MDKFKNNERMNIDDEKHLTVTTHVLDSECFMHWHNFFEIEIILSGEGICIINDMEFDLSEYNVFFLASTDYHYLKVSSTLKIINISFTLDVMEEKDVALIISDRNKRGYCLDEDEYDRIKSAALLLKHEYETDGACQKQLLQYILSYIQQKSPECSDELSKFEHYSGIKKSILFMEMHFREKLTLETIAKEAGYHPSYFSEIFKKVTGESFLAALNKLRLSYAGMLLKNGYSVSDACFLSGFGSLSNFFILFKKNFGISPSGYAKLSDKNSRDIIS